MKISSGKLNRIAKRLLAEKTYIYDPDKKRRPGGGYRETEKGWVIDTPSKKKAPSKSKSTKPSKSVSRSVTSLPLKQQQSLARGSKTDVKTLISLASSKDYRIRATVAKNLNTPQGVLNKLAEDEHYITRNQVAKNPGAGSDALTKLAADKTVSVRVSVATNYNAPSSLLDKLAIDKASTVRNRVAENINTSSKTLVKIINEGLADESSLVANPNVPLSVIKGKRSGVALSKRSNRIVPSDVYVMAEENLDDVVDESISELRDFKKTLGERGSGRNIAQLKADFIKNLKKESYETMEAFQNAQKRIKNMNNNDFGVMLASIFDDEDIV